MMEPKHLGDYDVESGSVSNVNIFRGLMSGMVLSVQHWNL